MTYLPYWDSHADYSSCKFFIRRMNTKGMSKPPSVPQASLPLIGFIYLMEGELLVESEGRTYLCSAGHLFLVPEGISFSILHYSDAIGFSGGFAPTSVSDFRKLSTLREPLQQAFWFDEGSFLGELFNMLVLAFEKEDLSFIGKGLDLLLEMVKETSVQLPDAVSRFLDEAFIPSNSHLSPQDYARSAGVSVNYLNRMVKKHTGHPMGSWIDMARLGRAKILLRQSDMPVIDVAAETGFEDQSYFSRFFRSTPEPHPLNIGKECTDCPNHCTARSKKTAGFCRYLQPEC